MLDFIVFQKFLVSIVLGALIGVEREMSMIGVKRARVAGIRTFIFITFFGSLAAFIDEKFPYMVIIGFIIVSVLVIASYLANSFIYKALGLTTEVSIILAYMIGVLAYIGEARAAIIFTVLLTLFLTLKVKIHDLVNKVHHYELYDTLKFALIAFVVLPFLPNKSYGPYEIFNPYLIWIVVILVTGISFFGYFLIKIFGQKKGVGVTGILGGLISSTAVMTSIAPKSKETKGSINPLVFAVVIASATMFFRILIEVAAVNHLLLPKLILPMGIMGVVGFVISLIIWKKSRISDTEISFKSPFTLLPGLMFGVFFVAILFLTKIANLYFGDTGAYFASIISGIANVDAITISMAKFAGKEISYNSAAIAVTLAATTNMIAKFLLAFFLGSKQFYKAVGMFFLIILATGVVALFFI